jgi:hypothetical protein
MRLDLGLSLKSLCLLSDVRFEAVPAALLVPGIAGSKKARGCRAWQGDDVLV